VPKEGLRISVSGGYGSLVLRIPVERGAP